MPALLRARTCHAYCPAASGPVCHDVPATHGLTTAPSLRTTWYSAAPDAADQTSVGATPLVANAVPLAGDCNTGVEGGATAPTGTLVELMAVPQYWLRTPSPSAGKS